MVIYLKLQLYFYSFVFILYKLRDLESSVVDEKTIKINKRSRFRVFRGIGLTLAFCSLLNFSNCFFEQYEKRGDLYVPHGFELKYEEMSKANQLLDHFPEKLKGAERIDKYLVKDADYVLVHVRQRHFREGFNEAEINKMILVQENIEKILFELIERKVLGDSSSLFKIYNEGVGENSMRQYDSNIQEMICLGKILNAKDNDKLSGNLREGLKERFNELIRYFAFCQSSNAVLRLYNQGLVEVLMTENPQTEEIYSKLREQWIKTGKFPKKGKRILVEDREDYLLRIISKETYLLSIVVLGGTHAFGGRKSFGDIYSLRERRSYKDNLFYWNNNPKNKDSKFSLIEITPKRLEN